MRTLNFTKSNNAPTDTVGNFGLFKNLYKLTGQGQWQLYGTLFTNAEGDGQEYNQVQNAFYKLKSTVGSRTLASYFNTKELIAKSTTWNFSSEIDFVNLGPFGLSQYDKTAYKTEYIGHHSFKNDILNLGSGSDCISLYLDSYAYGGNYKNPSYKSLSDEILDGGFAVTINGDAGNDKVECSFNANGDLWVDKLVGSKWTSTLVIPVARINGGDGIDHLSVNSMAARMTGGAGSDHLRSDCFSDFLDGNAGNDTLIGCNNYWYSSPDEHDQALNQKDILTGGAGRDQFWHGYGSASAYSLNGNDDFGLITDFKSGEDKICFLQPGGDILIDPTSGQLSMQKTSAYGGKTYSYTSRIYMDVNDDGRLQKEVDELLFYVCGQTPKESDLLFAT